MASPQGFDDDDDYDASNWVSLDTTRPSNISLKPTGSDASMEMATSMMNAFAAVATSSANSRVSYAKPVDPAEAVPISSIKSNADIVTGLTTRYHDDYVSRREADTKWHQRQMIFAHNLFTSTSTTTTPSPGHPAKQPREAPETSLLLLQHPDLLKSLAQTPDIWRELKAAPVLFTKLLDQPERFKDLLDNHLETLLLLLSNPDCIDMLV
jgi:hypothetical protein